MVSRTSNALVDIVLGAVLGFGTFGVVREVTEIRLAEGDEISVGETMMDSLSCIPLNDHTPGDAPGVSTSPMILHPLSKYDSVKQTLQQMSVRCFRNGDARYAAKHLMLEDATEKESDTARIDLAIEVMYLQVLSHPHIVKLRGLFKSDNLLHPSYFFIMDRLYGTLEDTIKEWADRRQSMWKGITSCFQRDSTMEEQIPARDFMIQRLLVAYDMASALDYMHRNKVVHR